MPRIEVETGQLHTASGRQAALADQLVSMSGSLEAAGSSAAAARASPEAPP